MNVKIGTKEKFTVITLLSASLTANMTEDFTKLLLSYLQKDIQHIILNMSAVKDADEKIYEMIASMQQQYYERNSSFVICGLKKAVENKLDEMGLLELLNVTPTESEAGDIVQMEEVERELLNDEDQ